MLSNSPGYAVKYSEMKGKGLKKSPGKKKEDDIVKCCDAIDTEPRDADRFEFTFNDTYYSLNFEIDEFGERIKTRVRHDVSRILTKDCIHRDEESIYDAEEQDEYG